MKSQLSYRYIGIDPGLKRTGWGVIDKRDGILSYVACGELVTKEANPFPDRLLALYDGLIEVLQQYKPDFAAIEETYVNMNSKSSLTLSQARGAILLTLAIYGLAPIEYSAKTIKKAVVGSGKAEKVQVEAMIKLLLKGVEAKSKDAIDALATAICHINQHRL